ncbi:flagellar biosynthesis protein FlhA [Paralimibaculum aggregatum]|uniref:Flagellar biosynthesis protein FlhA n=1 Tax=Paralimibaculum aggregatum TaxID=3036245 RepID=A0ABQ6LQ83_9RHOB|nr:flagellar biosynthesis protein FlhA [Limibaculum sp. NKW23]GMG83623.1 flagellar biosynthesis protein FlhA [Limibaculum sp. NKW23]
MDQFDIRALYQPTVLLVLALMAVIVMMILPMPAWLLDIGLAVSFALAILIFTVTLFIERPLDFSAFPTVLLASLMLRLSLNVSSTKLIIGEGHTGTAAAGGVIEGFAMFIMSGSLFLGLVVFGVLLIVNFIVITKGAGRMAEVGARFALDGMPGKQLAIDSDVAAGAISHKEAHERRRLEQEETTFFGSLDGASKFVKGDAIAGLLITLLNLVMGLAMGLAVHDLTLGEALRTYSVLTVGDGLVSQIPSVITSIAAALLLSKGGVTGSADKALITQLGGYPGALATVAALMALFAFVPGLPFAPFIVGAAVLVIAALLAARARAAAEAAAFAPEPETEAAPVQRPLGDLLDVDEIHLRFAPNLIGAVMEPGTGLEKRIGNMRRHIASEYGFVMPEVRLTDDPLLPPGSYSIQIQGVEAAQAVLKPGHVLVLTRPDLPLPLPGEDVEEPVYKAPARWIAERDQEEAAALGLPVVAPGEVVATHLLETIQANFARLFTRRALRKLIEAFTSPSDPARAEANRRLIDEFVPEKVPHDVLQTVLRMLLDERVSVRNLPLILEAAAEARAANMAPEEIVEHIRRRIAFHIVSRLSDKEGRLPLVQLGPAWEGLFAEHEIEAGHDIALPPAEFNRLAGAVGAQLRRAGESGAFPAVATSAKRRRFLRQVLAAKGIPNPVLSFDEIGSHADLSLLGTA